MKNIMWFTEIRRTSLAEVGGKGANLGEMASVGLPVPDGFVVTSGAYFWYIRHNKIDAVIKEMTTDLDVENTDALARASDSIKTRILSGEIPPQLRSEIMNAYKSMIKEGREPYVAVRSSATAEDLPEASFAGQQSTFLNIKGAENCVQAVKECWASLFEPRSIYYRTDNKFDHLKVGLAAVVQMMVQSEKAGVMFSVDPVSQKWEEISIEGAYGLGEIVVSGSVTPDRYVVDKNSLAIKVKDVAKQTWMIAKVNEKNENVNVRGEMQSRPITTRKGAAAEMPKPMESIPSISEKPPEVKIQGTSSPVSSPASQVRTAQQALSGLPMMAKPAPVAVAAAVPAQQ